MSNGIDAVRPGDCDIEGVLSAHSGPGNLTETQEPLHKRLLQAAGDCLMEAKIHFKHTVLEVVDNAVVLRGAPHCAYLPVCCYQNGEIVNLL